MKTWTIDELMTEKPCYSRAKVEELYAGRDSVSIIDIFDSEIPAGDKVWMLCRPGVFEGDGRQRWLDGIVTRAVTNYALHCGVKKVEDWAVRWLDGSDRSYAAACAATGAAWAAWDAADATDAAWATWVADAATWAADAAASAASAAWAAYAAYASRAASAAYAAYASYASRAAWASEEELQVADARKILTEGEE